MAWKNILQQIRQEKIWQRPYDMRKYWTGVALEKCEEETPAIIQALKFQQILDNTEQHFYNNERIAGNCLGFMRDHLPLGITQDDYNRMVAIGNFYRHRNFTAGFDHTLADYPSLLSIGIDGLIEKVYISKKAAKSQEEIIFLDAILIELNAWKNYIIRLSKIANEQNRPDLALILSKIAGPPPNTLHEAIQLVWITHIIFKSEERNHMALGRIDQYLYPFYLQEKQRYIAQSQSNNNSSMAEFTANILDLFCHLWVRFEEIEDVQNICIGGLTSEGGDATNDLTYICLEATRLVQSPYTNLSARFHDGSSHQYHRACVEVIKTGVGFPAIFNDHLIIAGLVKLGIPLDVARDYCLVGCIETMLPGRQPPWSDSRFNILLCLMKALNKIWDRSQINSQPISPTYNEIWEEFINQIQIGMQNHANAINISINLYPNSNFPDIFLSLLTRYCIDRRKDIHSDGTEFPRFHGIAGMGLGSTADSLAALKMLICDQKRFSFQELMQALAANFQGYELIRQALLNLAPKYGNHNEYVDQIAADIVDAFSRNVLNHTLSIGGRFVPLMAANIQNISAGQEVGASPDGRLAFTSLSDAASPYFGRDLQGPTAFLGSVATPNYENIIGGTVINIRFDPELFKGNEGTERLTIFTRVFVDKRIPELQFNFTSNQTLLDAQLKPENFQHLVVRVSGFSAFFVNLDTQVQADIIRRRMHDKD